MKKGLFLKNIDLTYILILIISVFSISFFIKHTFWIFYDIGRELYFPSIILKNQILYKDIFNIFGPFSYLFNSAIYKCLGSSLNVIYFIGYISAMLTISGVYFLSKLLINKKTAFVISLFTLSIGVTTTLNFNYTLPYSYAALYGFISFIWSLYFYVKYKNCNNAKYAYLSGLLSGIAIANKYEFFLYGIFLIICIFKDKNLKIRRLCEIILLSALPSIICYFILFIQGLTWQNCIESVLIVKKLVQAPSCRYLYTQMGTYFSLENIIELMKNLCITTTLIGCFLYCFKLVKINKYAGCFSFGLFSLIMCWIVYYYSFNHIFSFLPAIILLFLVIKYKYLNSIEKFLLIAVFLESIKVFWNCDIKYYGVYFAPGLIIAGAYILNNHYKELFRASRYFVLLLSCIIIFHNIDDRFIASYKVKINTDNIYTFIDQQYKLKELIKFIENSTGKNDRVVIYPEGLLINYITGRETSNLYYALNPAFLETFGEQNIIKYYEKNKPEFFVIIHDNSMSIYGHKYICENYAHDFCKFINRNYTKIKSIKYLDSDIEPYFIYKRN